MTLQYSDYVEKNNIETSDNSDNLKNPIKPNTSKFNKTIKKSPQIAELYNKIHNSTTESEEDNKLASFVPLEPSINSKNEPVTEKTAEWTNNIEERINNYTENYYRNSAPQYSLNNPSNTNDQLLNKLNYVIQLLEEQKDERTNYVSEELILYTFLGIFIIFIIDSFAKASKYIR